MLPDLALESEAASALSLRLARTFDAQKDEAESLLRRVLTPAATYWICKRGPAVGAEAMEVLGVGAFGALPGDTDFGALLARAWPAS